MPVVFMAEATSDSLEQSYQQYQYNKQKYTAEYKVDGRKYKADFSIMVQTNPSSKKVRKIGRIMIWRQTPLHSSNSLML